MMETASSYPVNLKLSGRKCAVIGGGPVALRRTRSLAAAGAQVLVIAPKVVDEIRKMADQGQITWLAETFSAPKIVGMFLVVCATDYENVNRSAAWAAKATGALVNMAAPPTELSDFTVPARVEHGDLRLTVSTNGSCPELSRVLGRELADEVAAVYGPWLDRLQPLRQEAKRSLSDSDVRLVFWRSVLDEKVMGLVRAGKYDEAEAIVRDAIGRFRSESQNGAR